MAAGVEAKNLELLAGNLQRVASRFKVSLYSLMMKTSLDLYGDILLKSPVDKGMFRSSWKMRPNGPSGDKLFSVTFSNKMPYAGPLEFGSPVGGKPWASPGPKTVLMSDRIFSRQAPDGVASAVLSDARMILISKQLEDLLEDLI